MRELSRDDVIIAVMGQSGTGKSTFINTVANSNVAVGHKLTSCTSEISTVRLSLVGKDLVFVDTPAFDHTDKTDIETLKMVADWLKTTYEKDILLSGLLYCHRISNTHMDPTSVRHLRIFEELCGKDASRNVIFVTTMWDEVDEETGNLEEEKMKTKYWDKMIKCRSTTGRFLGTRESALQLLQPLMDPANRPSSLLLQQEMVDMGKKLTKTSAGRQLFSSTEHIIYQRQEVIQQIQTGLDQDASAKLSTVKSVDPKKIQENPPQEIWSDQKTVRQTVEVRKVEPRKKIQENPPEETGSNQKTVRQAVGLQEDKPQKKIQENPPEETDSNQKIVRQAVELQEDKPQRKIQEIPPKETGFNQKTVRQAVKLQEVKLQKRFLSEETWSNQKAVRQAPQKKVQESLSEEVWSNQKTVRQTVGLQEDKLQKKIQEILSEETWSNQKSVCQTAGLQEDKSQKKIQEILPEGAWSNQRTKMLGKVEPQEVIPQKVEKVDLQEGRHSPTSHNLYRNPSIGTNSSLAPLTTKLQENKSDKYTRNQDEYTAQSGSFKPPEGKTDSHKTNNGRQALKPKKPIDSSFPFLRGALAKQVNTEELSQDDVIIAVMGPSSSGKSTFIELAIGFDIGMGHTLESCTSEIKIVKLSIPELVDGDIVFVEFPGFDDTHKSDIDILNMVAGWLKTTYEKDILLSGILYFHPISDNRMAGTPLKNLRMFEELCGKDAFHNVILTTTMWDELDYETGNLREQELKSKYWKSMLDRGSTTSRFMGTRESALRLIKPLIDTANTRSSLLLQQEMVDMRTKLSATSAGVRLFSETEHLVKKRQEVLGRIQNAMKYSNQDKTSLPALQEEYQRVKMQLNATVNEMQKLRLPLGKRLTRMTRKWFSFKFS